MENPSIPSSIATLNYSYWHDEKVLNSHLKQNAEKIQCVVSKKSTEWDFPSSVEFGKAQQLELWDYADGIDTLTFLFGLAE